MGRFFADKLSDHLPGKPQVAVTNVEGVGGTNMIYNAPGNGNDVTIGVAGKAIDIYGTASDPNAQHDPSKVKVLFALAPDPRVLLGAGDLVGTKLSALEGSSGPEIKQAAVVGSPSDLYGDAMLMSWLCDHLKLPCRLLSVASDDGDAQTLMLARGEINVTPDTLTSTVRRSTDDLRDGKLELLTVYGADQVKYTLPSGIEDPPQLSSLIPADQKAAFDTILPIATAGALGKHFWASPNLPTEAVDALRQAFSDIAADNNTMASLNRVLGGGGDTGAFEVNAVPIDGAAAQKLFDEDVTNYMGNKTQYEAIQQEYFDKFWKK